MSEKIKPICEECGSEKVVADAFVQWNIEKQSWEVQVAFDKDSTCHECGDARNIIWVSDK